MRLNVLSSFNRKPQSQKYTLCRLPDIVENPFCKGFLTALTHISAECPVVVAHIGTARYTVHTAFDDTSLLQQSQHATAYIVLSLAFAPLCS